MRRRAFIAALGGAAAWPLAARAQQAGPPIVGFLNFGSPQSRPHLVEGFRAGLRETGYVEGKDVLIEYRWANDEYALLAELAADLVRRQVNVIAAPGSIAAALEAKAATNTIPVIFSVGDDPVKLKLVNSLSQPGTNATGVSYFTQELLGKRLEILHELVPAMTRVGVLINPKSPYAEVQTREIERAASAINLKIRLLRASGSSDIDAALETFAREHGGALVVVPDPLFTGRRAQIVGLTKRHTIPAIYTLREYVEAGGLISYGTNLRDAYRQVGVYAGRILKGEQPATLPVVQPTKFELVVDLRTAKALGLDIPPTLLARADEVIE
jgi:putative ABC transport system substrate-binding protein